jgi:hypothetical protein
MTKLREYKHKLLKHGQGMVGADLTAFAAVGALCLVYLWYENAYRLALNNLRSKKHVYIRLLHIAVQDLHLLSQ